MEELLKELTGKDDQRAYAKTKEIVAASELSPEYYPYFEMFASLLKDRKSYVRVRALMLCCCQARWDGEGKLRKALPAMLALLSDEKPTVVRQCLAALREVVRFRPELSGEIQEAAKKIDPARYKDSMTPLIKRDVDELLKWIECPGI